MQFTIDNATVIGFSQEGQFFGGDFRFGNRRLISLECFSRDISNESEVSATAIRELITLSKTGDYARVHINGISFDAVRFNSFNIDSDDWVRGAKCSIELEAYEEGIVESENDAGEIRYLTTLAGDNYKGLEFQELAHFLDEFSEDFDFQRSANSRTYTHAITLKFSDAAQMQNPTPRLSSAVALAKEFAGKLFEKDSLNRPEFAFMDPQLAALYSTFDNAYSKTISEEYDNINNTCTFTENFEMLDTLAGDRSYSTQSTQNFEYGENGIITVREEGQILGLLNNNYNAAEAAVTTVLDEAKVRLTDLFNEYTDIVKAFQTCDVPDLVQNEAATAPRSIREGKTLNIFEGTISYNVLVTNDPSKLSNVNYSYASTVVLDGDYYTATEQGTIEGIKEPVAPIESGDTLTYQKYEQALDHYETVSADIDTRIKDLIPNPSPEYTENEETSSLYKGSISYSRSFSNAPRYAENDGISKQITVEEEFNEPIARHTVENILNSPLYEGGENQDTEGGAQLLQIPGGNRSPIGFSLSSRLNKIKIVGKRDSELSDLLDLAKEKLSPSLNYLENFSYDFNDENTMILNLNCLWK